MLISPKLIIFDRHTLRARINNRYQSSVFVAVGLATNDYDLWNLNNLCTSPSDVLQGYVS